MRHPIRIGIFDFEACSSDAVSTLARESGLAAGVEQLHSRDQLKKLLKELVTRQVILLVSSDAAGWVLQQVDQRQGRRLHVLYTGNTLAKSLADAKPSQTLLQLSSPVNLKEVGVSLQAIATSLLGNQVPITIQSNLTSYAANYLASLHSVEGAIDLYLEDIGPWLGMDSISVYAAGSKERVFRAVAGTASKFAGTESARLFGSRGHFTDHVTLQGPLQDESEPGDGIGNATERFVATESGWHDSLLAVVFQRRRSAQTVSKELVRHAAQEIFGLYRTERLYRRAQAHEHVALGIDSDSDAADWLWSSCERMRAYFQTDAASVLRVASDDQRTIRFVKHLVHYSRREISEFTATRGFAYEVVRTGKALIVAEVLEDGVTADCLEYDPDAIELNRRTERRLVGIESPGTVENEMSILYFPIIDRASEGKVIAVLKVGNLVHSDAFAFADLCDLRSFAQSIGPILATIELKSRLDAMNKMNQLRSEMLEQADVLYYYKNAAIGLFHQMGNILLRISSELLKAKLQAQIVDKSGEGPLVKSLTELYERSNEGKRVIADARERSKLGIILRECKLVADIVRPAIDDAEKKTSGTNLLITRSLHSEEYIVKVDVRLMRETLANVINNAILAVRDNASTGRPNVHVSVRPEESGEAVSVQVEDTGIGISADVVSQVFNAFMTTRGGSGGSGLGLYFARHILEKFNGAIEIAKTLPRKGTTVKITLPYRRRV